MDSNHGPSACRAVALNRAELIRHKKRLPLLREAFLWISFEIQSNIDSPYRFLPTTTMFPMFLLFFIATNVNKFLTKQKGAENILPQFCPCQETGLEPYLRDPQSLVLPLTLFLAYWAFPTGLEPIPHKLTACHSTIELRKQFIDPSAGFEPAISWLQVRRTNQLCEEGKLSFPPWTRTKIPFAQNGVIAVIRVKNLAVRTGSAPVPHRVTAGYLT